MHRQPAHPAESSTGLPDRGFDRSQRHGGRRAGGRGGAAPSGSMQCEVLRALRLPGIMVTSLPHHVPPAPRPSRTTSLPHHTPLQRRAAASEGWADFGKPGGGAGRVLVTSPSLHTGHVPREAMCHVPREVICHVPRDGELTAAGGVQVGDGRVGGVSATVSQRAGAAQPFAARERLMRRAG